MNLDLTNALWIQPDHALHGETCRIIIRKGSIESVEKMSGKAGKTSAKRGVKTWDVEGAFVSAGWWDCKAELRDPGHETAETLKTGMDAAAQGGFTRIAPSPRTSPAVDGKAALDFLRQQAQNHVVGLLPLGCVSAGGEGKNLAELFDMRQAGAVAFSDDAPLDHPELLRRALEYVKPVNGVVYAEAAEHAFQADGVVHEGTVSTQLGLAGIPVEQETMRLERDLAIARYTGGRLHIPVISSAAALELIRAAKADGVSVTCGTAAHHLCFDHQQLLNFNSDFKTSPPLREASDREALVQGLIDGTIDVLCSDHRPRNPEEHDADFTLVRPGIAGLHATAVAAAGALQEAGLSGLQAAEVLHQSLVDGPRKLLGESATQTTQAELTIFTTDGPSDLPAAASKAANTLYGVHSALLAGCVLGVITPGGLHRN